MMDYLEILRQYDDPIHGYYPPGFDFRAAQRRFARFIRDLSSELRVQVKAESGREIQDASFHGQIFVPVGDNKVTAIRFSNFGNMATISEDEPIPEALLVTLKRLLNQHEYVYIPASVLEQPYTGNNPGV